MNQKYHKAIENNIHESIDTTKKMKDLVELDRLLNRYTDCLIDQQIPLIADITRKFKKIEKLKKIHRKQKTNIIEIKDKCYICQFKINANHPHYQNLCMQCGNINFIKRNFKANMNGKIALVTGARIKIGFYTVLSLLRNGCYVIATTRFANDAVDRYIKQQDYSTWKDKLQFIQVSMNSLESITKLSEYITKKFGKLDILINNAAQTIRRPKIFYNSLNRQKYDPDNLIKHNIDNYFQYNNQNIDLAIEYPNLKTFIQEKITLENKQNISLPEIKQQKSQCTILQTFKMQINKFNQNQFQQYFKTYFPQNIVDQHQQQIDLRPNNSWIKTIQNTSILELAQVLMVNCIAPFTLIQQLTPIMKHKDKQENTWIINVSSMQGNFSRRTKTQYHPHTNIAKAGLNMITRTCGQQFSKYGIVMVSVDTGWNTIQQPNSYHMKSPLDCIDGAARILDPIYSKLTKSGIFYKNFQKYEW